MPLFNIQIRKAINTNGIAHKWSNRYFVEEPDITAALQRGINYWQFGERPFHGALVFAYEVYANQVGDTPFTPGQLAPIPTGVSRGGRSQVPSDTLTLLPLWNVVRVDFPVANSRVNRKFYRTALLEGDVTSAQLDGDVATLMNSSLDDLATSAPHRDEQGNGLLGTWLIKGLTSKRLGRDSSVSVPTGPSFG